MCMFKHKQTMKKSSIKSHNLHDKNTNLITLILWSTFILVLFKKTFIGSQLNSQHTSFSPYQEEMEYYA
jgi:hypothetical protein